MKLFKKILSVFALLTLGLLVVACDKGLSKKDFDAAARLVAPNVNVNVEVKGDFKVITEGMHGVTIEWTSSDETLGKVGTEKDANGLLTVSIFKPEYEEGAAPKTFVLTAIITSGKHREEKHLRLRLLMKTQILFL